MNPTALFIRTLFFVFFGTILFSCQQKSEWKDLFNGKDLSGWRSNESEESFQVEDGMIIASGPRSHLFYVGDGKEEPRFTSFELTADIKTTYHANSGIYFHTTWQDEGWPEKGYEAQVNNSHKGVGDYKEVKKGGSLYGIRNVYKAFAKDSTWYNMRIRVEGKKIKIWIDDKLLVDYTEPVHPLRFGAEGQQVLSGGTFALQCHDPDSKVYFKNIRVKELEDPVENDIPGEDAYKKILELQSEHFPVIDMDIVTDGEFNVDSALQVFYTRGINLGFVVDLSHTEKGIARDILKGHVRDFKAYPVFLGVKISLLTDNSIMALPPDIDYLIGEIPVHYDEEIEDKDRFVDSYIEEIMAAIQGNEIDILASPTTLPQEISADYDSLWTKERMLKVIQILKKNNVAIEINNDLRVPGLDFIKLAKENGCTFTCGHITDENGKANMDYFMEAIDYADLNYKDIFIPGYK